MTDLDPWDDDEDGEEDANGPRLALLGRFAASLAHVPWFAHTGAPLDAELRRDARDYLDLLGFPQATVTRVASWADAAAAAESLDWDSPAWEIEELLRADLTHRATEVLDEEALELALTHVSAQAAQALEQALRPQSALWDIEDEALLNAALGAGVQAAHQAALVLAAGAAHHAFALKFQLYEQGRWPIGVAGLSFNIL